MIRRRRVLIGRGTEAEKVFKIKFYRGKRKIGTVVEKVYSGSPMEYLETKNISSPHFKVSGSWVTAATPEGALAIMKGRASEKGLFAKIFGGYVKKNKAIVFQEYVKGKPLGVDDELNYKISRAFSHLIDVWGDNIIRTKEGYKIIDFTRKVTPEELERNLCSQFQGDLTGLKRSLKNFLKRKIEKQFR